MIYCSKFADNRADNTYGQTFFPAKYSTESALLWHRIDKAPDGDEGGNVVGKIDTV
jgi:hypothetical protein